MFMTPEQMAKTADRLRTVAEGKTKLHESPWQHLKTERTDSNQMAIYDARVKELVFRQGKTQKEAAALLGISNTRVHRHVQRIKRSMGL